MYASWHYLDHISFPTRLSSDLGIVAEYYEAACVVQRETRLEFAREYLSTGAGAWLALAQRQIVGCIALRRLSEPARSEEHTSELQSRRDLVCRLLLEKKKRRRS